MNDDRRIRPIECMGSAYGYAIFKPNELNAIGVGCVFTTVIRNSASSISLAENIIFAICEREKLAWTQITFYDLQTHLGYIRKPGIFEFDLLKLEKKTEPNHKPGEFWVDEWRPVACPLDVVHVFKDYIGQMSHVSAP